MVKSRYFILVLTLYYPSLNLPFTQISIIIHSKYFPVSDWVKPHA